MPVNYQFKRGVDTPMVCWMRPFPNGSSQPGTSCDYDGTRFFYWAIQYGSASAASTTHLWRYDPMTDEWQFLTVLTSAFQGIDICYDRTRNVLYIVLGNASTGIQCFNLNSTAVTVNNISCAAWAVTTLAVLPAACTAAASIVMPNDIEVPAVIDSGVTLAGGVSTTTNLRSNGTTLYGIAGVGTFHQGLVGLQVRYTSGPLLGQRRTITAVVDPLNLTTNAFGGAPGTGDTWVIELPTGTVTTGGANGSITDVNAGWAVNQYANCDVIMTSGTLAGQRRRIASNTATVLTIAGTVSGNARTGAFGSNNAGGDTYQIVPSSDFLYLQTGTSTALYRLDVVQTAGSAWSAALAVVPAATGGGGNMMWDPTFSPFALIQARGANTAFVYLYDVGLNSWRTLTTFFASELINTGASVCMVRNRRRMFIQINGAARCYFLDMTTGLLEPAFQLPYAAPSSFDGHRAHYLKTSDGIEWIYLFRAGGQELFRVPLEWF